MAEAEVPTFGLPKIGEIVDVAQGFKNLFSDPNKMAKRQLAQQTMMDFIELLTLEAARRRENVQGVKDAERKAPIRAALMGSLMSGGLEGFGSEFSPLRALARPRTFVTEDAAGNPATSTQGPGGEPATPEQLQQITQFLEPEQFLSLREKGRQAAAGQTPESMFTPMESPLAGGLPGNMQFGVNKKGDAAQQRAILDQASQSGLTPEQEQRYGIQPRAMGGPVEAGQPYLVGERGPEVMVPSQSGQIEPDPEEYNKKQLKKVFQILAERGVGI